MRIRRSALATVTAAAMALTGAVTAPTAEAAEVVSIQAQANPGGSSESENSGKPAGSSEDLGPESSHSNKGSGSWWEQQHWLTQTVLAILGGVSTATALSVGFGILRSVFFGIFGV